MTNNPIPDPSLPPEPNADNARPESNRDADSQPIDDILGGLTDEDIADAMRDIPGFLDISLQDFRELYRASVTHALARLARQPLAGTLMRTTDPRLTPEQSLLDAVSAMAGCRTRCAAVIDGEDRVIGILTETDVLRRLGAESALALLCRLGGEPERVRRCCAGVAVSAVMTGTVRTIDQAAGLPAIMGAFAAHPGRAIPVVDDAGRLLGMLLRADLIRACGLTARAF